MTVAVPVEARATGRHAAMVIDANTGQVLHSEAADEPRYPASLTKIMTLYLVFELLEQGRLKPDTRIKMSAAATLVQPSKLDLGIGEEIALIDAVKALITKSANDVAVAIAEHIAGSEDRFARLMTERARQIGMKATTFRNAHGLSDPAQTTTARDMLTLSLRLMDDFPQHYRLFATRTFSHDGSIYRNHNTLLGTFEGTDGIKTGYTSQSGFNLVASVRRDGRHVVGVVFGGASAGSRNAHMRQLLTRSLGRASTVKTRRSDTIAGVRPSHRRPDHTVDATLPPLIAGPTLVSGPGEVRTVAPIDSAPVAPRRSPPIIITPVRPVLIPMRPAAAPASTEPATARPPAPSTDVSARIARSPVLRPLGEADRSPPPVAPAPSRATSDAPIPPSRWAAPRLGEMPTAPGPASPARPPTATGSLAIQIGAYSSESEARRQLESVRVRTPLLQGRTSMAEPFTGSGRQVFRARFSGFDAASAAGVCQELRRQQLDCYVLRAH